LGSGRCLNGDKKYGYTKTLHMARAKNWMKDRRKKVAIADLNGE
jgi:hypothetical protein